MRKTTDHKQHFTLTFALLLLLASCSSEQDFVPQRNEMLANKASVDNIVSKALDSIDHYSKVPPDFTLTYTSDNASHSVWGHVGSSIHFGRDTYPDRVDDYLFTSHRPIPARFETTASGAIRVRHAAFTDELPLTLENTKQDGDKLLFVLAVGGTPLAPMTITSSHFSGINIMPSDGNQLNVNWIPVVKWVAEHVVAPLAVVLAEKALSTISDNGSNTNMSMACINQMQEAAKDCRDKNGIFNYGHGTEGECPRGCWTSCTSKS